MNVHEYVSMEVMRRYGISVAKGNVAYTVDEAKQVNIQVKTFFSFSSILISIIRSIKTKLVRRKTVLSRLWS